MFIVMFTHFLLFFQTIQPDDPYCSIYNEDKCKIRFVRRKGSEPAVVDYVALDVKGKNNNPIQKVSAYC